MENEEQQSIPPESEKDATLQEMNVPESETTAKACICKQL